MVKEFFYAISYTAAMNLHIKVLTPGNNHHMAEAMFKSFAKALDMAKYPGAGAAAALCDEGSLLELSPRFIKVDLTIIRGIDTDPDKQQIVQNIVAYAHPRSMQIIAEGVETAEELKKVLELGVDGLQGYFLAKPANIPARIAPAARQIIENSHSSDCG